MGTYSSKEEYKKNDNINNKKAVLRQNSFLIEEKDILIFKLKNLNDTLYEKLKKYENEVNYIKNIAKQCLYNNNNKEQAKIWIAKKRIIKKNIIKLNGEIILIEKRLQQIKQSNSDLEYQNIIKDSNKCIQEVNELLDNQVYLDAKELLEENEQLNNEANIILNDIDQNNDIDKELEELLNPNYGNSTIKKEKNIEKEILFN